MKSLRKSKINTTIKFAIIALALVILSTLFISCGVDKSTRLLKVDYANMTIVGSSLKDFSKMFDEQDTLDPLCNVGGDAKTSQSILDFDANGSIDEVDRNGYFDFTVDLFADHMVQYIYAYFEDDGSNLKIETGTPFAYENSVKLENGVSKWNKIEVNQETRYLDIIFQNGKAPSEILIYGYQTGEAEPVNTEKHNHKTFEYLLGMNGNTEDYKTKVSRVTCTPYFRDYINWAWFYDSSRYPQPGTQFATFFANAYDGAYANLKQFQVEPVPCFMFGGEVAIEGIDSRLPEAYAMYGELLYQIGVRYGNNAMNTADMVRLSNSRAPKKTNLDLIKWIEAGNEPNGEGNDGFNPYEMAALTSTSYDGHCGTVLSPSGHLTGVKNADPNLKMAMAGLAGVGTRYVKAMVHWMKYNRPDGTIAMDAFNVHTYCRKTVTYNGYTFSYGVAPEIGNFTGELKNLVEFRDKYYPDIEIWLTEFGWDTNTSYATENACHPYGDFTARDIQAMWLVRAYFMLASIGVDRCAMYMCSDLGDEETSVGKYGTSGVIASNGEFKQSYYYIYTLRNTMGDMYFAEILDSGNENVWIYRFENGKGKSCYAVWCPTMDSVEVNDYKLTIDGSTAEMVKFANFKKDGVRSDLTVENNTVTVNVSEKPILIFSE
ncbi:MAG: hypothetical protein II984_09260 [Clostridia bacterium]|nr:hypothetical protein [Clostridia bacterium]